MGTSELSLFVLAGARSGPLPPAKTEKQMEQNLVTAVHAALEKACQCKVDPNLLKPVDANRVLVTNPAQLPKVFSESWSGQRREISRYRIWLPFEILSKRFRQQWASYYDHHDANY